MAKGGAHTWYFPDGYLPEKIGGGLLEAHEALMILNTSPQVAHILIDLYFDDRVPVKDIAVTVGAERVICIRMDKPEELAGAVILPMVQYAVRLRSDVPVVAMLGRLDTTQSNLAYYTNTAYPED